MALTLATWNINSVRLRAEAVTRFLKENDVDVVCLQEIKCQDEEFPYKTFERAGYGHIQVRGQKGHHGVATVSRLPLEPLAEPKHCAKGEARVAVSRVDGIELHNYYAPSGGDEPDPDINDKFAHKLEFWKRATKAFKRDRARLETEPVLVLGDLNIAPGEFDVHNHKRLLKYVGHTPVEADTLTKAREAGGFIDVARAIVPEPELFPTWWSYRVKSWTPDSPGWRLDHMWASPALAPGAVAGGRDAISVLHETRTWEKPSDHAPLLLRLKT